MAPRKSLRIARVIGFDPHRPTNLLSSQLLAAFFVPKRIFVVIGARLELV
jgi:hypothetical protein